MSVYVDELFSHPRRNRHGNQWCHMMSDTIRELHAFAAFIGVNRCWFNKDHYDLNPRQRDAAIFHGAKSSTGRDLVRLRQEIRNAKNEQRGLRSA